MRKLALLIGICCLDDENSLTEPARIAPAERQLPSVGNKFQYELEGDSFTVLKLAAEHLP